MRCASRQHGAGRGMVDSADEIHHVSVAIARRRGVQIFLEPIASRTAEEARGEGGREQK